MSADYGSMSRQELEEAIRELKARQEDNDDLRDSVLGQQGQHVPSAFARKFEREDEEIASQLARALEALEDLGGET